MKKSKYSELANELSKRLASSQKSKTYVVIKAKQRYASYLSRHLQKEHPATKNKITVVGGFSPDFKKRVK